jgi:hypothetical protein
MFAKLTIASLLLALLSACAESGNLLGALSSDQPEDSQVESHYTRNSATAAAQSEIVALRIADSFGLGDRAKILRAVSEWNLALNGFVRFEVIPDQAVAARGLQSWRIVPAKGDGLQLPRGSSVPLAVTQPITSASGLMVVHVDRVGRRDLGGVVMHELGHVLGVGHGEKGLMAAHYHPSDQKCVDKATIGAVAAKHQLPVNQLNWCETNVAIAR